ncbi:spermidine synthase [Sphingomonas sp. DT-51]|uniref:spermidine synthase n=1 Tax=Sphingomonas sp. DT-51 TaxID=3396165 RepID=UPI003F1C582C
MTTRDAAVSGGARKQAGLLVDTAEIPGGGELRLLRHGTHFEIMFGNEQLMGSWSYRSEEALATLALRGLGREPRVLIGGLGMGFTLAAARATLPMDASIIVAELVPKIVAWAGGHLRHLFGSSLSDLRVSVEVTDVHDLIVEQPAGFDAILLDVDNGPDGLISLANERLYSDWGLRAARLALRPNGILAIWSAYPDHSFTYRLRAAGFEVEEISIDTDGSEENPDHTIWLATAGQSGKGSGSAGTAGSTVEVGA